MLQGFIKKTIAAALLIFASALTAANQRVAVIDLEQVFREFYKSRIAEEAIRQQAENYRSYLVKLNEQLKILIEADRVARANTANYALTEADKQKVAEEAARCNTAEAKKRAEILDEIKAEVHRRAVAEGFDIVIDRSGRTLNGQPVLLYYPQNCDITASVLRELNRSATAPTRTNPPQPVPGAAK